LYVLSSISIIACVWGFRHDRSVEVCKLFCMWPYSTGSPNMEWHLYFATLLYIHCAVNISHWGQV
jgi:hypothetical protein